MNESAPLWDDTYGGNRWTYGPTYRPLGYAQVPAGWIIKSDRPHPDFRFGTVDYPFRLPDDVAARAELTLLTPAAPDTPGTRAALGQPGRHTPGPWHKGGGNGEGYIFGPESHRMRVEAGGTTLYPICQPCTGYDQAEDEANERLIIAAPALLHAVEVAYEIARTFADPEHCLHEAMAEHPQWTAWAGLFKEALAAATAAG